MKVTMNHPTVRRVIVGVTAFATSWALAGTPLAIAADSFWFDGDDTTYTDAYTNEEGSFSWDGGDNFAISDYQGPGWIADGDTNLDVQGTNDVEGQIGVLGGDLNVSGDGTLNVDGDGVALGTMEGDVTIDGTTVQVTSDGAAVVGAMVGDVTIKNGADVTATSTNPQGEGIVAYMGSVNISDSSVTAVGGDESGVGIHAFAMGDTTPQVNIDSSDVEASGGFAAILAESTDKSHAGEINIVNSDIVTPAGAMIADWQIMYVDAETYGQGITTAQENLATNVKIEARKASDATECVASAAEKKLPAVAEKVIPGVAEKVLPTTGDATVESAAVFAAAGVALVSGAAVMRKRTQE